MHIAIDDTYGPESETGSKFVTGGRRTHVAVVFPDDEVDYIRKQIADCLEEMSNSSGVTVKEFHFADIYNRRGPWDGLPEQMNLRIFEFFSEIYSHHKWPVYIQTIDDRTLSDHDFSFLPDAIGGIDLTKREGVSLLMLLIKIKIGHKGAPKPITLLVDEGYGRPGAAVGKEIFHDWSASFHGSYASSGHEPLLQIADFLAFSINRSTHLATKTNRTDIDNWFIDLIGSMQISSTDMQSTIMPADFTVKEFDEFHRSDRKRKELSNL